MKFHIRVTEDDVGEAATIRQDTFNVPGKSYARSSSCPVALAVKRALGIKKGSGYVVSVGECSLAIYRQAVAVTWLLPTETIRFIHKADLYKDLADCKKVGTTEFILDWPYRGEVAA